MNEVIDTTQWLPRNSPVVNAFRMAHGDLDGVINSSGEVMKARRRDDTIAQRLIALGYLEDYHFSYGLALLDLQKAFYGRLSAKINSVYLAMLADEGISSRNAAKMYEYITAPLKLFRVRIIERACNEPYYAMSSAETNAYRECFELLTTLTDEAIKKVKYEIENGLAYA